MTWLLLFGAALGLQLLSQVGDGRPQGRGQGTGRLLQVLPHFGLCEGRGDGFGDFVPGTEQGTEGLSDLLLTGSPAVGDASIGLFQAVQQPAEVIGHRLPGVVGR